MRSRSIPIVIVEHYETTAANILRDKPNMPLPKITNAKIKVRLNEIKTGKAPGPDQIECELFKFLKDYL